MLMLTNKLKPASSTLAKGVWFCRICSGIDPTTAGGDHSLDFQTPPPDSQEVGDKEDPATTGGDHSRSTQPFSQESETGGDKLESSSQSYCLPTVSVPKELQNAIDVAISS